MRKTFLLSSLLEIFFSNSPENVTKSFTICRLQCWLENHYDSSVIIQTPQGQGISNILCLAAQSQLGMILNQLLILTLNKNGPENKES